MNIFETLKPVLHNAESNGYIVDAARIVVAFPKCKWTGEEKPNATIVLGCGYHYANDWPVFEESLKAQEIETHLGYSLEFEDPNIGEASCVWLSHWETGDKAVIKLERREYSDSVSYHWSLLAIPPIHKDCLPN